MDKMYQGGTKCPQIENSAKITSVDAYIVRNPNGVYRIIVKRAKFKHWFELGTHPETNAAFARALRAGKVRWNPTIREKMQLFSKNL